jgi:hypothetical protein
VRIVSSSTTNQTSALPMPVPANPAGSTFQATLANSSDLANAESAALGAGSKASSGRAANKQGSKQEKAQSTSSVSDESAANVPVPPTDQKPTPVQDSLGGQASADGPGDGSATPVVADLQFLNASPDLSRQIAAQAVAGGAEPEPTTVIQPNVTPNADKDADGIAQADAQTAATAAAAAAPIGASVVTPAAGETFKSQIELPIAAISASRADAVQSTGKTLQKNAVDAAGSKNSDLTNATDAGKASSNKAKAADAVGALAAASSHSAQSDGQSMQHSQPDASQVAPVVMQKVVDGTAQAVPMHAAIHVATSAPGTLGGLQDGTYPGVDRGDTGSSPLDGDEATATSGINASKLIQTLSETEMRVGMHSAEFGNISIRTSVSQQQILAQISLDHGVLSQAISGHLSSLQAKLGNDYGLQTLIQMNYQGASTSGEQGSSSHREQRASASPVRGESAAVPAELDVGMSLGALASAGDGYRLDIRA